MIREPISQITPSEFELEVKRLIDLLGAPLVAYESEHLYKMEGHDGEYIIDIVARFSALGGNFVVMIECKRLKRKVERQDIQVLHSKVQSLGAQKGMVFSTEGFQSGAIEFAKAHGISTVQVSDGRFLWCTRNDGQPSPPPPDLDIPKFAAWLQTENKFSLLSKSSPQKLSVAFGLSED